MVYDTKDKVIEGLTKIINNSDNIMEVGFAREILNSQCLDDYVAFNQAIEKKIAEGYSEDEAVAIISNEWEFSDLI